MAQQKELQWSQRLNSGNIIELNDMYEPDAWLILPGLQPFINLDNVSKGLEMILKDVKKIELTTVDIHAIGRDFLVENGKAKIWRYSSSGEKHEFSNYEVIWHRDSNGMWKIMRDIVVPM
jgi:ketosteroid isomerase-like protein